MTPRPPGAASQAPQIEADDRAAAGAADPNDSSSAVAPPAADLQSPAYPALIRTLTVIVVIDIIAFAIWLGADLRAAEWTATGAVMFALALLSIVWMGWWIVNSRTRVQGDDLIQTWLWTKRVHARDVTRLKFVHIPRLERIVAPRLLVHRRGGGMSWFHSADPELLVQFAHRVAAYTGKVAERAN